MSLEELVLEFLAFQMTQYRGAAEVIAVARNTSIQRMSATLRSTSIRLLGSGIGSVSPLEMKRYFKRELPQIFQLAAQGQISMQLKTLALRDVESVWRAKETAGFRTVVLI